MIFFCSRQYAVDDLYVFHKMPHTKISHSQRPERHAMSNAIYMTANVGDKHKPDTVDGWE